MAVNGHKLLDGSFGAGSGHHEQEAAPGGCRSHDQEAAPGGCRQGGGGPKTRAADAQKVCRKRGGESCAFDGAMIVLQPIADAVHIVHGPIGCAGNSWEGRGTLSKKGVFHTFGLTTAMDELDIVYGAEDKLLEAVLEAHRRLRPQAVFVHATCVSGLTGEDLDAVCKKAQALIAPVKVIPVNAAGFAGPKNLGNRMAGEVLLDHVIGTAEPEHTTPFDINLIGEYNIAGDLWQVEPVFEEAGMRVLSRITGDSTFREVSCAHRARLNLVVCSRALINVAREMERKYGIPYLEVSFFGKTEMARALRGAAEVLERTNSPSAFSSGAAGLKERVEAVIENQERKLALALGSKKSKKSEKSETKKYPAFLAGKKAVLYTGGVKSWSMIQALMDLGMEIAAVGTKKSTLEDEEKMREILGPDAPLYEDTTPGNLRKLMLETGADVLVAGGRNQYLAVKEGFPFVDVNQERHTPYAGYGGLVNLAEDISRSIRFHERQRSRGSMSPGPAKTARDFSFPPPALTGRPELIEKRTGVYINPLGHSQSLGAAMALQGIDGALPLIHGAQGCSFLQKVLLTKHFREPIALQSTKLFTEEVVMGSEEKLLSCLQDIMCKQKPGLLAVLTSGLSEVKGDDLERAVSGVGAPRELVLVRTPDYSGGLEEGYSKAVGAVIRTLAPDRKAAGRAEVKGRTKIINILAGSHLTPADFYELREAAMSFGLDPVILPDLSALDGSRQGMSALASGGATPGRIARMNEAEATFVIGQSLEAPAMLLKEKTGIDYKVVSPFGLAGTDGFFAELSRLGGRPVAESRLRQRRMLVDAMRDAHFYLSGKKVCLALEPDHAAAVSVMLHEMGATVALAVVPQQPQGKQKQLSSILADRVRVGDLFSIEEDFDSFSFAFDLLVSNSHAQEAARRLGVPLYQAGFPVYKKIGHCQEVFIGYRGAAAFINGAANRFFI